MHDLADVEHGIEDDWVVGGLRLPPEEGIGDGPTGLHLQRFLLQEVHKGKEPVHGKQVAEVMHVGQDLADHGQELQGGRRRGRRGGEGRRRGRGGGKRTYSAGPQSTMYIRMYVYMHNFGGMVVQHTYVLTCG